MKKFFLSLILGLSLAAAGQAQEQAIYSQYHLFPILVNPGYTGFENYHQFVMNVRRNWTGFPGTPLTYTLMYNGPLSDKLSLGGGLYSEKVGSMSTMRFQLNYAFRFQIQQMKIGLGLSTEFLNRSVTSSLLNHPLVDVSDDALEDATDGQKIFDASVGVHGLYDNRFFISLAIPNTIRARLDEAPVEEETTDGALFQYYIFQMGYIFAMPDQNFKVIPSLALRKVRNVPYQVDFNVQGRFLEDKLIAGLTFRPSAGGAASFLLGTKYKQVQLIYSYDVGFTRFQQYNAGSHELSLAFGFERKMNKLDPSKRY